MVNFGNEFESGHPQVELYRLCWDVERPDGFCHELNMLFLEARADRDISFDVDERLRAPGDKTNSYTALMMLCERAKPEEAAFLIAQGASVTAQTNTGETPLHIAARSHGRMAAQMTSMLADKLTREQIDIPDCRGWTPLHLAVRRGCLMTSEVLIDRGARVNTRNNLIGRMTPLLIAADKAEYPICLALLQAEADPNASDNFRNTPLHRACMEPVKQGALLEVAVRETVKYLCSHGADSLAKNDHGKWPIDCLKEHMRDFNLPRHLAEHQLQSYMDASGGQADTFAAIHEEARVILSQYAPIDPKPSTPKHMSYDQKWDFDTGPKDKDKNKDKKKKNY